MCKVLNIKFNIFDVPLYDGNELNKVWYNKSVNSDNIKVLTLNGWTLINEINIIKKMVTIKIETEINTFIEGADLHYIFTKDGWKTFNEININDYVLCGNDFVKVTNKILNNQIQELYDISTDDGDYLTCGNVINTFKNSAFLSHNTITAAITILHYCIFNESKGIMIVANKGDTVVEIIDKIKNIYKLLPFFLKPGIINWNSKAIVFDNGCRIKSQARSKEPAIGFTIDFLYMDEFAHLPAGIARHYYKAAVPTVSSINNSKILITSTPNGSNLFKELVEGAELPEGHPDKNQYKCIRVYWHEVAGRLNPKFYPLNQEMSKYGLDINYINKTLIDLGYKVDHKKEQSDTGDRHLLEIDYNKGINSVDNLRLVQIKSSKGVINLSQLGSVTNWKESETKLIGGEEAFNQEYNLQFLSGAKRILSAKTTVLIEERKTKYSWDEIEVLNKLRFMYDELLWDKEFIHSDRKKIYGVTSIDLSEGLGLDYTTMSIFNTVVRSKEWLKDNKIKNMTEAFQLKQVGTYANNRISPKEFADLFYLLNFEYFNSERMKCVFEVNGPGGRFYDALPNCFDGNNNYGDFIQVRYKHNKNDKFKKPGKKVTSSKKDDVKMYIDAIENDTICINEVNTALEMENFIKVETPSGGITYRADSGHDDRVMTIVNVSTFLETQEWQNMCHSLYLESSKDIQELIDSSLDLTYNPKAMGYKSLSNALRQSKSGLNSNRVSRR